MANPFSLTSGQALPYGPGQSPDNVTALPAGEALVLGSWGTANLQYYDHIFSPFKIKTGATAGASVSLILALSEDNSKWSYGVSVASGGGDQSSLLVNLGAPALVQTIATPNSATQYWFDGWSIESKLGYMPSFWALFLWNKNTGALDATAGNFNASQSLVSYA